MQPVVRNFPSGQLVKVFKSSNRTCNLKGANYWESPNSAQISKRGLMTRTLRYVISVETIYLRKERRNEKRSVGYCVLFLCNNYKQIDLAEHVLCSV